MSGPSVASWKARHCSSPGEGASSWCTGAATLHTRVLYTDTDGLLPLQALRPLWGLPPRPVERKGDVDQRQQHRYFNERPNSGRQSLLRPDAKRPAHSTAPSGVSQGNIALLRPTVL